MLRELLSMNYSTVTGISFKHYCTSGIELVSNLNTCFLLAVHAKQAVEPMYKVMFESHLQKSSKRDNRSSIEAMQTGETRIKPKAKLPPNTNPMELDHVRSRFQSLLSFIYASTKVWRSNFLELDR
jgi:hypothetical protein